MYDKGLSRAAIEALIKSSKKEDEFSKSELLAYEKKS